MRKAEFGFTGTDLRDRLVAAILRGDKTSTSSLLSDYEQEGEALPEVGERMVVVDNDERPVAVIETTEVRVIRIRDVDLAFAVEEGRGSRASRTGAPPTSGSGTRTRARWETRR